LYLHDSEQIVCSVIVGYAVFAYDCCLFQQKQSLYRTALKNEGLAYFFKQITRPLTVH